jgi:hypothetical protein
MILRLEGCTYPSPIARWKSRTKHVSDSALAGAHGWDWAGPFPVERRAGRLQALAQFGLQIRAPAFGRTAPLPDGAFSALIFRSGDRPVLATWFSGA